MGIVLSQMGTDGKERSDKPRAVENHKAAVEANVHGKKY